MTPPAQSLQQTIAGLHFQNPVVLAAGTAAYGRELADIIRLDRLGGIVTKAVSPEARQGNASPRVGEFEGGMINAVGLANPGLDAVCEQHLPWLATSLPGVRKIANVVGFAADEFARVVRGLEAAMAVSRQQDALDAYEINVSCPNVKAGGTEFGADFGTLRDVVRSVRSVTQRPLWVKLSPALPDIGRSAAVAVDAGADAITLVNTLPGLVIDVDRRAPAVGFGSGGISGAAIRPIGVLATWKVRKAVNVPLLGIGGVGSARDALEYMLAGASLVGVGTAMLRDPRAPERIVRELGQWCDANGVAHIGEIVGTLNYPA